MCNIIRAASTIKFPVDLVLMAVLLTATLVISLTLYAIFCKTDFTMMGGVLFILGGLMIVGTIIGFFFQNRIYHLILSIFVIFLFGLYLIYDTQLIVGKKANKYLIDDYIRGAMNLYLDIIIIFLEILKIFGNQ